MSLAPSAWTALGSVAAAGAAVALLSGRQQPEADRLARRWLAVTAVLWGGAAIAQNVASGVIGAAGPLGLAGLASSRPAGGLASLVQLRLARAGVTRLADGCLLAASLFLIGWVTVLAPVYATADVSAGAFAADLINPLADLAVLAGILYLAARGGWRGLLPCLALLLATAGDCLAVSDRIIGSYPGWGAQVTWLAGICLLGATPVALARAAKVSPPSDQPGH